MRSGCTSNIYHGSTPSRILQYAGLRVLHVRTAFAPPQVAPLLNVWEAGSDLCGLAVYGKWQWFV